MEFSWARFFESVCRLRNQIFLLLLNFFLSLVILTYVYSGFISADKPPEIHPFTPDSVKELQMTAEAPRVTAGMYVENFYVFDLAKNNFVVSAIVWFSFDPTLFSLETIGKFSFDRGDIVSISKPDTRVISRTKMIARYMVKISFTSNLYYRPFPIDDHRLFLSLTNKFLTPKECIFEAHESGFALSPQVQIPGWRYKEHSTWTGYSEAVLERSDASSKIYHPVAIFSMNFQREGYRQLGVLFLPLFFILFLAFIVTGLDPEQFGTLRLTMGATNVTALIAYRFVIEVVSPAVGYFMLSDMVFNLFLGSVALLFVFNLATSKQASCTVRGAALLGFHTLFICVWFYLFNYWIFA